MCVVFDGEIKLVFFFKSMVFDEFVCCLECVEVVVSSVEDLGFVWVCKFFDLSGNFFGVIEFVV